MVLLVLTISTNESYLHKLFIKYKSCTIFSRIVAQQVVQLHTRRSSGCGVMVTKFPLLTEVYKRENYVDTLCYQAQQQNFFKCKHDFFFIFVCSFI